MGVGLAGSDKDSMKAVASTVKSQANGSTPGIQSTRLEKSDLEKLSKAAKEAAKSAKQAKPLSAAVTTDAIYTAAATRDAAYAVQGRKYMRTMTLNTRAAAAFGRFKEMVWAEQFKGD